MKLTEEINTNLQHVHEIFFIKKIHVLCIKDCTNRRNIRLYFRLSKYITTMMEEEKDEFMNSKLITR